jgi:hypothetical protein
MGAFFRSVINLHQRKRTRLAIIFCGFIIAFVLVRLYSLYIVTSLVFIQGFHIHHFYFGAFILWLGGIVAVLSVSDKGDYVASGLIGVGMGLFGDEIGLLLNCTTPSRICTYAFPNTGDIIVALTMLILALMVLTGYTDYRFEKREAKK